MSSLNGPEGVVRLELLLHLQTAAKTRTSANLGLDDCKRLQFCSADASSQERGQKTSAKVISSSVEFIQVAPSTDTACNFRFNCTSPLEPGIAVGSFTGAGSQTEFFCTMGFHVRRGNNEQFLTAGHCDHVFDDTGVFHQDGRKTPQNPQGTIGVVRASAYATPRIELPGRPS